MTFHSLTNEVDPPRGILGEASRQLLTSEVGRSLLARLEEGGPANITGLPDPAKSFLIASLQEETGRPAVILVPDEIGRAHV